MRYLVYLLLITLGSLFLGGVLFFVFEEDVNPQVNSLGDGIWLSVVTVSTVGYGDVFPMTVYGKIVAALFSIGGFALVGVFAALVGRILFERMVQFPGSHRITIDTARDQEFEKAVKQLKNLSRMNKKDLRKLEDTFDKIFEDRIKTK